MAVIRPPSTTTVAAPIICRPSKTRSALNALMSHPRRDRARASPAAQEWAWWSVGGGAEAVGPAQGAVGQAGDGEAGVLGLVVVGALARAVAVLGLAFRVGDEVVELAA